MNYRWMIAGLGLLGASPLHAAPQTESATTQPARKAVADLAIKAATIEVAWLSDPATYPYRLRAEQPPGEEAITLTGYVPTELVRDKAAALAREACVGITLRDQLVILPNMAIVPVDRDADPQPVAIVQALLDKSVPTICKQVQLTRDDHGVVTVSGRVDDLADRRKIIRSLQAIPGCSYIKYDLRMAPPVMIATPMPVLDLPKDNLKEGTVPPPPSLEKSSNAPPAPRLPAPRFGALTSKTPAPGVQQADHKATPHVQVQPAQATSKASEPSFFLPSASGLTPPAPAVTLGAPNKGYKSNFVSSANLPAAADHATPGPLKPPDLMNQPLPPAPVLPAAPPLPEK